MRRGFAIAAVVLLVLAGIGVGVGAYNAGVDEGIERQLEESGEGVDVIRVVGDRDGPRWGFPFGILFFPLFLFGIFLLVRAVGGRRRWGGPGPWGPDSWREHGQARFDDWHRKQHEQTGTTSAGGEPA